MIHQILDTPPPATEEEAATEGKRPKAKKIDPNAPKMSLSEIGPRFVLVPVKIFEGSFNGATIYENKGAFGFLRASWSSKTLLT